MFICFALSSLSYVSVVLKLQPSFHVEKCSTTQGKSNVCRIHMPDGKKTTTLAFEEEKTLHLFTFYIQCQLRLKEECWGKFHQVIHDANGL